MLKIERSTVCIVRVTAADASQWFNCQMIGANILSQNKIIISIQRLGCGICLVLLHSDSKLTERNTSRI